MNGNRPTCDGFVCLFSCFDEFRGKVPDSSILRVFEMEYDYEIYVSLDADTDIDDALVEVENNFLSIISTQMGLSDCDLQTAELQFSFGNGYNWIFPYISISVHAEDAIIVTLSSVPLDVVNSKKGESKSVTRLITAHSVSLFYIKLTKMYLNAFYIIS